MTDSAFNSNKFIQVGMSFPRGKVEIFASAFRIETEFNGDCFKQCGFTRTIFTNEKSHRRMKFKPMQMSNRWNTKWIFIKTFNGTTFKPHRVQQ